MNTIVMQTIIALSELFIEYWKLFGCGLGRRVSDAASDEDGRMVTRSQVQTQERAITHNRPTHINIELTSTGAKLY